MKMGNGSSPPVVISSNESLGPQINLLTKQVDVQENEAAASIYNDLVTKYDDKVLVELQATGSTPSSPQEGKQMKQGVHLLLDPAFVKLWPPRDSNNLVPTQM